MLSEGIIREKIQQWLNTSNKAGEKHGGSDHLSFVSYEMKELISKEKVNDGWLIEFTYTQYTETEFTCYPDNPPYVHPGRSYVLISDDGQTISGIE